MKRRLILLGLIAILTACQASGAAIAPGKKNIVVTYAVLGALVRELVGDRANVIVPMPNGQDPHEWEPSAKDIETIMKADLIVQNGLQLEAGLERTLARAQDAGVKFFTAADYVDVRKVGQGEGIPGSDRDQMPGADDPHLWLDPLAMKQVVEALATQLKSDLNLDVSDRAKEVAARLEALNAEITDRVAAVPEADRKLVTGHESLGYFARRYGFQLIGAVVPSLTSQAEASAADLAVLKQVIVEYGVKAIFIELGTPQTIARAIGQETGAQVIELATHVVPPDGSYFTFMRNLATTITDGLR